MKRLWWGKLSLTAAALLFLASSAVRADEARQILVIRETGKTDRRCQVDHSVQQANGDMVYDLHDLATSERLRVVDTRVIKTAFPLVIPASFNSVAQGDAAMIAALAASPFTRPISDKRVPTLAEQAVSGPAVPRLGLFRVEDTITP